MSVKMAAEYLEEALHFDQLAAAESDPELKVSMLKQAEACRKLAKRALHDQLTRYRSDVKRLAPRPGLAQRGRGLSAPKRSSVGSFSTTETLTWPTPAAPSSPGL
jgi:hypothetical protein